VNRHSRRSPLDTHLDLAVRNLRQIGYDRINLDLIFGLPNQSLEQWKTDLWRVVQLNPDSITIYDCVYKGKGRGMTSSTAAAAAAAASAATASPPSLPSWALYGEMYDYGYQYLLSQGYHAPYGSVNFSRIPKETGTSRYFENRLLRGMNYVGLGNYASTMIDRYWIFSPHSVEGWLAHTSSPPPPSGAGAGAGAAEVGADDLPQWIPYNAYSLPIEERVSKYLLASLSFGFIDEKYFTETFPTWKLQNFYSFEIFEELVEKRKWLRYEEKEGRFYLNQHCFQYLPQIRAMFHSKRSLSWFEEEVMLNGKDRKSGGVGGGKRE
jgi:oxygen-independent coproporphyrinogen III oxidase